MVIVEKKNRLILIFSQPPNEGILCGGPRSAVTGLHTSCAVSVLQELCWSSSNGGGHVDCNKPDIQHLVQNSVLQPEQSEGETEGEVSCCYFQ